ncbi:MAG: NAD(P)H-dependent oxidoreductase [Proteobacteria bacterium]|nr:NAD(P)H-dependent oxidoreductase [Pseudomonadota bacterium]
MKHAVILAHPKANSFTASAAQAYREAVEARKQIAVVRDLYRMGFDPCLKADEIPGSEGFEPHEDVVAERAMLSDANVFALFYPLWLNAPPAILTGYLERVFGFGFAYGRKQGGNTPLLTGKKLISFTSSGAPTDWVVKTGAWDAMRKVFDEHFAAVCGLEVADHVHFGSITPGIRPDVIAREIEKVRAAVAKHF